MLGQSSIERHHAGVSMDQREYTAVQRRSIKCNCTRNEQWRYNSSRANDITCRERYTYLHFFNKIFTFFGYKKTRLLRRNLPMQIFHLKGLFDKAVLMGEYVLNCLVPYRDDHLQLAFHYGRLLGFKRKSPKELLHFLKKLPIDKLFGPMKFFRDKYYEATFSSARNPKHPCLEFYFVEFSGYMLVLSRRHLYDYNR